VWTRKWNGSGRADADSALAARSRIRREGFERGSQKPCRLGTLARVAVLCGSTLNPKRTDKDEVMLYTLIAILVVLWLLGFTLNVGGGLIHTLLVIAAVIFLFNLINGRRSLSSS
jgi:hypothetical protein